MNKSRELDRLVAEVDQLLARLPEDQTFETDALREKVDHAILAAWLALGSEDAHATARMHQQRRIAVIAAAVLIGIATTTLVRRVRTGLRTRPTMICPTWQWYPNRRP